MEAQPSHVAFAGLGAMGFGMASNLLKAGFQVNGFDVNPDALTRFAALGGSTSSTVRDACAGCSKFLVMVASPDQVDSLVFPKDGLVDSLPKGAILCLLSTLPPDYVIELNKKLATLGRADVQLVDCPVSGGVVGANAGTLSIMMGGNTETLKELETTFKAISAPGRLFSCGDLGSSSTLKMLNQLLAGVHIVVAAEALAFAKAAGVSSREAYNILMNSEAGSWIMGDRGLSMLSADWSPKSAVTIFTKDLGIVNGAADSVSLPCPIASVALSAFIERAARGHGRDDDASVVCNYEEMTGASVAEANVEKELPSPPAEVSSPSSIPTVVLIADDKTSSAIGSTSDSKTLVVVPDVAESLDAKLGELAAGSIVGVSGSRDRAQKLVAKYPQLQFLNYDLVRSVDLTSHQFLFSVANPDIVSAVKVALPAHVAAIHVKGSIASASIMALAIRAASLMHIAATGECFNLAQAKGVATDLVYNLISGAAGSSNQFNGIFPLMMQKDFVPSQKATSMTTAIKDLASIKEAMTSLKFPGRLLDATYQIFKTVNRSLGGKDASIASVSSFWDSKTHA